MSRLARVAIATARPEAEVTPLIGGLVECLRRESVQTQLFYDRAVHACECVGQAVSGRSVRYLDSWLTSRDLCREYFQHGSAACDLSILVGAPHHDFHNAATGGRFDELVDWLNLPVLALVDAAELEGCRLPQIPACAKGVLLEGISSDKLPQVETEIEALFGLPVVGVLPPLESLGRVWRSSTDCQNASRAVVEKIADLLRPRFRADRFWSIAASDDVAPAEPKYFRSGNQLAGLHVALAYDEAIHCYFPGVLDLLELLGARVTDFSPLADESLPAECNLVYLGCGPAHRYAERFSQNQCLKMALHRHVERGGRLFAEGGGLALMCEEIQFRDGRSFSGAGIFAADAQFRRRPAESEPREWTLAADHWLGSAGATLRGYTNRNWRLQSTSPTTSASDLPPFIFEQQAVGSLVHVNFAANQPLLERFAGTARKRGHATF